MPQLKRNFMEIWDSIRQEDITKRIAEIPGQQYQRTQAS